MGYFANGTEGAYFQDRYCGGCVHGRGGACPIWSLHLDYNYDQHDANNVIRTRDGAYTEPLSALLARFIRRETDTTGQVCTMHRPVGGDAGLERAGQVPMFAR